MTQVENYKHILEKIFHREISFSNNSITNNCIGALNPENDFHTFRTNFIERLKRICEYFKDAPEYLEEIVKTAKQIGQTKGYKWSGSYSELVALDYWIQFEDIENIKFPDRGGVTDYADSIAKQIGQVEIDLDISLDLHTKKIYTDVKSLIPTHIELTDQILNCLKSKTEEQNYLIGIDDISDVDYLKTKKDFIYELQSGGLIQKLVECVNKKETICNFKLQSGTGVTFRIEYPKAGINTVLSTTRAMEPYKLAIDYKFKILDYYNKLLIDKPSLITFVVNPWFNKELNISKEFIKTFYRSLTRRIFIELSKDSTDMGTIFPELNNKNIKISDVVSKVSGIIFINDNSILKTGKDINDVYIYLNPNATNTVLTRKNFDILNWSTSVKMPYIEDFYYDNY